jgi:hypothetical protein
MLLFTKFERFAKKAYAGGLVISLLSLMGGCDKRPPRPSTASGALPENVSYAVKSSFLLSFLESVANVVDKLKDPKTRKPLPLQSGTSQIWWFAP